MVNIILPPDWSLFWKSYIRGLYHNGFVLWILHIAFNAENCLSLQVFFRLMWIIKVVLFCSLAAFFPQKLLKKWKKLNLIYLTRKKGAISSSYPNCFILSTEVWYYDMTWQPNSLGNILFLDARSELLWISDGDERLTLRLCWQCLHSQCRLSQQFLPGHPPGGPHSGGENQWQMCHSTLPICQFCQLRTNSLSPM